MIEVQKCKSGKINQELDTKVFKQTDSLIPKNKEKKNRFNLRKRVLHHNSNANPALVRDKQVTRYRMVLNLPR